MKSSQSVVMFSIIVVLIAVSDIYCGDGSVSVSRQATPVSPVNDNNAWSKLANQNPVNPVWGNPNQQSTTTPWPALGARRPANQQIIPNNSPTLVQPGPSRTGPNYAQVTNTNRNVGYDLSYGLNPAQNNNPIRTNQNRPSISSSGTRNVGVDLSYGLNAGGSQSSSGTSVSNQRQNQNQLNKVQTPTAGLTSQSAGSNLPTQNQKSPAQNPAIGVANTNQRKPVPGLIAGSGQTQNTNTNPLKLSEEEELREFSEALLKKDVNNAAKYVTVNYQGKTTSRSATDEAPQPLLTIKPEALDISTIARMLLLHNNYILETNANEYVTPQEKAEENNFLDALLTTSVMQHTRNFLIQKGKISKDPKDFRDKLKEIWFNMYSRGGGKIGSSGFEHVFLTELKGDEVSGLHNWLYFNEAESKKQANYLGYLKKLEFGNKGAIVKHHFQFAGKDKPVGSMFIGTSPEFEIALYSTCFLLKPNEVCPLRLGGQNFIIRTFTFRYRGKKMIGSAFPEI